MRRIVHIVVDRHVGADATHGDGVCAQKLFHYSRKETAPL
jgi:hypothetical protein